MAQIDRSPTPTNGIGSSLQLTATEYQENIKLKLQRHQNGMGGNTSGSSSTPGLEGGEDGLNTPRHSSDASDPKRRRIARACDQCRKKKIKCDGKTPSCSHCQNYNTECIFTMVEKKRQPPKGAKYIEGLENRLGRMESLLKLSGLLPDFDSKTDLGTLEKRLEAQRSHGPGSSGNSPSFLSRPVSSNGTPNSSGVVHGSSPSDIGKEEEDSESMTEKMSSLVTNGCGETRFIGSSSGFSIFSPKGMQWVNSKTGDKTFQKLLMMAVQGNNNRFDHWRPDVWDTLLANRAPNALPPKEEARIYINDYFRGLNILFPLYHQETFEDLLEQQYSDNPPKGTGWYASFNIVMALGCKLKSTITRDPMSTDDESKGWKYFQNAACVYPSLALQNTDILTIQALLAMSLFLQGTANPQPLYSLIGTAVRVAFSIGLHRRANAFGFGRAEAEQRKRVFWIIYMIDKDLALRTGRPSAINDEDLNVELPEEESFDGLGMIDLISGSGRVNLFRRNCVFAQIQSHVYMQLYSAKAAKQSDGELLNTIGDLDRQLEEWRDSIPLGLRPEHEIAEAYRAMALPIVVMHFSYFNCLATIHRMSIAHSYWSNRLAQYAVSGLNSKPLNPRVFSSAALSVSAARSSIHLLKYIDSTDSNCTWLVLYYPVTALITLFANILQNPQDVNAKTDLRLMGVVIQFVNGFDEQDKNHTGLQKLLMLMTEFDRLAQSAIQKAEKDALMRRKRKKRPGDPGQPQHVEVGPVSNAGEPRIRIDDTDQETWPVAGVSAVQPMEQPTPIPEDATSAPIAHDPSTNSFGAADALGFDYQTPGPSARTTDEPDISPLTKSFQESFSSPFVPQSLWNLNQTFEWDWAHFAATGSLSGDDGNMDLGGDANNNDSMTWGMNMF